MFITRINVKLSVPFSSSKQGSINSFKKLKTVAQEFFKSNKFSIYLLCWLSGMTLDATARILVPNGILEAKTVELCKKINFAFLGTAILGDYLLGTSPSSHGSNKPEFRKV